MSQGNDGGPCGTFCGTHDLIGALTQVKCIPTESVRTCDLNKRIKGTAAQATEFPDHSLKGQAFVVGVS